MFASRITKQILVRDDDGQDVPVILRKLSARQLRKAFDVHQLELGETVRRYGAEFMRQIGEEHEKKQKTKEEKEAERFSQYDRDTVLNAGVASWALKLDIAKGLQDLDEETSELLFTEIMRMSKPTPEEEEGKDDYGS